MTDGSEIDTAFRHYFRVGPIDEDWDAWSKLFTDDATYDDHYWGTFHGPGEIARFLNGTMAFAPQVYTALVWYVIDGDRVVWKGLNRADNPDPDGADLSFPSLQILTYAGDGRWRSEEDWWIAHESKLFAQNYAKACARFDPEHPQRMTRLNWGDGPDWSRPDDGHVAHPSWAGRDVAPIATLRDIDFGVRNPK